MYQLRLHARHVDGVWPLGAVLDLEGDDVTLVQVGVLNIDETVGVEEDIFSTIIWSDETKAFIGETSNFTLHTLRKTSE